jgi:hypothetical protein
MRQLLTACLLALSLVSFWPASVEAGDVYVNGYYRNDGTYVKPHYRSAPDGNFYNNWSTKGNVNPYTGQTGTRITPPSNYGGYGTNNGTFGSPYGSQPSWDYQNPYGSFGNQ